MTREIEVRAAPDTRAALKEKGHLRCVLKIRYKEESRHSQIAIPWAQKQAQKISRALLKDADCHDEGEEEEEEEEDTFTVSPIMVTLLRSNRPYAHVSFDLFLKQCSEPMREEITASLEQPMYVIARHHGVYHARRDKGLDTYAAEKLSDMQDVVDPRPYFQDMETVNYYEDGHRIEEPLGGDPNWIPPKLPVMKVDEHGEPYIEWPEVEDDDVEDSGDGLDDIEGENDTEEVVSSAEKNDAHEQDAIVDKPGGGG